MEEMIKVTMRPDWFGDAPNARHGWSGADDDNKHVFVIFLQPDNRHVLWTYAEAVENGNPNIKRGWWYTIGIEGLNLQQEMTFRIREALSLDLYFEE